MKKKLSFLSGLTALSIILAPFGSSAFAAENEQADVAVTADVYVTDDVYYEDVTGNVYEDVYYEDVTDDVYEDVYYEDVTDDVYEDVYYEDVTGDVYNEVTFDDIQGHWAQTEIEFLASNDIIKGVSATNFAPNEKITRAAFITLVVRSLVGDNIPKFDAGLTFKDMQPGAYYVDAVQYAAANGIVSGDDQGNFNPNDSITRQEIAKILGNTLHHLTGSAIDWEDKEINRVLTPFSDRHLVASWAQDEMAFLIDWNIINGVGNNQLDPTGNATRAQAAVMIFRGIASVI